MISIRNTTVERLARELADLENIGMTEAIQRALEERAAAMARLRTPAERDLAALAKIREKAARLVVRDSLSEDEILGYGPTGAFE